MTNRPVDDYEGMTPDYQANLEYYDPKTNANKFWRVKSYGIFVVRHWGRHGTRGQSKSETRSTPFLAINSAKKLAYQKQLEGYRPEVSALDRFAREV